MKRFFLIAHFACWMIVGYSAADAQLTGTISGRISDVSTDEPLVGANVLIVGTGYGAASDINGRYSITGIPPGTYTVRASLVGYQVVESKNVEVQADRHLLLNFKMASTEFHLDPVVVTAEALVNPDATSSARTITARVIDEIPNVKNIQDILAIQPGFVRQGSNLFLRGGRANEVQYIVDGIPVNSILEGSGSLLATSALNQQLQQLYAGVEGGAIGGGVAGLVVSSNAIQSVNVTSSGFDAEFGNAQSGVIDITTKTGSDRYTGSTQFRSDRIGGDSFNESYFAFSAGGPEPITGHLLPLLGLEIPGKMTFFVSSDFNQKDGAFRYQRNEYYNSLRRRISTGNFLGNLLGFPYTDYQHNAFTFNSKVRYDLSSTDHITYSYRASLRTDRNYRHAWRYRADSAQVDLNTSAQTGLQWTHFWGEKSFHRLSLGRLANRKHVSVAGLPPYLYSAADRQTDLNGDGFNDLGSDQLWLDATTTVWTVKFDYTSRIHRLHLLKTGMEFHYEEIRSTEIQYPLDPQHDPAQARGLFPELGRFRWVLNNFPNRGGLYVQDNIQFFGINVNFGIRYDYLYPGRQIFYRDFVEAWATAIDNSTKPFFDMNGNGIHDANEPLKWAYINDANELVINKQSGGSTFLYYLTHGEFSPRVAIGYPITDRIVFYFNYGHFLQFPDRNEYFRDPFTLVPQNWIGNPDLKPQRTVQYEAGFDNQFLDDMAVSVRGFYKDIFDYPALSLTKDGLMYIYINLDYASARGFDITLTKALTRNFSATAAYAYQIAKGRASNPFAQVFEPQFQLPRETRLNWDQRSTINMFLSYRVGPKEDYKLFGLPFFNNWGASVTWNYGSGFPYTPYNPGRTYATVYLRNVATGPYSSTINLAFFKGFMVFQGMNMMLTLDVQNLLDRKNVVVLDPNYGFSTLEGRPYQLGDYDPTNNIIYPARRLDGMTPPNVFGNPRQVLFGIRLNWD